MIGHKFPYEWTLKDAKFTKDKGTVFSCFACGGGSTMGYKLAGFDVLGCNEIDPKMMEAYKVNHNPKYSYLEPIQTFKLRKDLPKELYNLEILDGSPPCSSFSMAGNREKDWGKDKKFREGQACQVLDRLFFDFIDLAKELKPKVVIAENVKGILMGNAIAYVREIYKEFDKAGYVLQHWTLDASKMGVPQRRERIFFIALRKDLAEQFMYQKDLFTRVPKLDLCFNEPGIIYSEIKEGTHRIINNGKPSKIYSLWEKRKQSDNTFVEICKREYGFERYMTVGLIKESKIFPALVSNTHYYTFSECGIINKTELLKISTFPKDYIFSIEPKYIMGMSVPPVMTAQIADRIYNQWLNKL
jgi:DNA (cytosine-5)-methyltransferase 1